MLHAVGRGVVWVVREHVEHPAAGDRFAPHKRGPPIGVTGVHDRESRGHTTYSSGVVRQRAWTSAAPPCADRGNTRVRLRDRGAARRAAGPPWNPVLLLLTSASSSPPHTGVCSPLGMPRMGWSSAGSIAGVGDGVQEAEDEVSHRRTPCQILAQASSVARCANTCRMVWARVLDSTGFSRKASMPRAAARSASSIRGL